MGDSGLFNNRNRRDSSVLLKVIILVVLAMGLICPTVWAATVYKVVITVTDPGVSPPLTEQPISGADVKVKVGPWDERPARGGQSPGDYEIDLTVNHDVQKVVTYDVTVSKSGYDTVTKSLVLQFGDPLRKNMPFPLTRGSTIYYLHLNLLDADSKEYIPGASVTCTIETDLGGRSQGSDLGAQGGYHVSLTVDHRNYREVSCLCKATKRGYEDGTRRYHFKRGDQNTRNETFYLKSKVESLERGQNIHVNVRRADDGRPVNRAHVSVGNQSGDTDGGGDVTVLVDTPGEGVNREHNLKVQGDMIAQLLAIWLLPLGYLVYKSGFLPKFLGVLLMIACFGYLIDFVTFFLFPKFDLKVSLFTFWGEMIFPLWLLIKGVNVERWKSRALESA